MVARQQEQEARMGTTCKCKILRSYSLVMAEHVCVLTVMISTQSYTYDKMYSQIHINKRRLKMMKTMASMVLYAYDPDTLEAGGSGVENKPWLPIKFKACQGCVQPCFKKTVKQ